jgi:nitroreductase
MSSRVYDVVRTVLAVREYADRAVPDEVIRRIADAGRLTASGQNIQPWHFVVVKDRRHLERLGELVRTGGYVRNAAFAIVVAYDRERRIALSDASRAIQSMILTAWDEGVGSNWTGFAGLGDVARDLGLPEQYDVCAVLPFGYPAKAIGKGKKNRKPFDEVVSGERFGDPLR